MTIGERIQMARKKAGMKQSDLAEKLGVAVVTIGQYERGQRTPRLEQLRRIATTLGVEWTELVPEDQQGKTVIDHMKRKISSLSGPKERIDVALDQLNADGQQKAVERVEELTEIPKYQREKPQNTPTAPSEGKDTAPPESPLEGPQEGK